MERAEPRPGFFFGPFAIKPSRDRRCRQIAIAGFTARARPNRTFPPAPLLNFVRDGAVRNGRAMVQGSRIAIPCGRVDELLNHELWRLELCH